MPRGVAPAQFPPPVDPAQEFIGPPTDPEEERIEVVPWPLEELDGAIAECRDAKSLIGLLMFRNLRSAGDA